MAVPGKYTISAAKYIEGEYTSIGEPVTFDTEPLGLGALPPQDKAEVLAFQKKTAELQRAVMGAAAAAAEARERIGAIKQAIFNTPELGPDYTERARALELQLMDVSEEISGDPTKPRRAEPAPPSIMDRVQNIVSGHWSTTYGPTRTHLRDYEIAAQAFGTVLEKLRTLVEVDLRKLEEDLEAAGAPWTPGRGVPVWKR